jgi:hypothetical protein
MNITNLASMGYACGLETLDEALTMMELHWDALSKEAWLELNFNIIVHQPDLSRRCADVLGPEQCKKEDDEMDAFFSQQPISEDL